MFTASSPARLCGRLERIVNHCAVGYACDRDNPTRPLTVEITIDGRLAAAGVADRLREDLAAMDPVLRGSGFRIPLPCLETFTSVSLGARLAATHCPLEGSLLSWCPQEENRLHALVEQVDGLCIDGFAVDVLEPRRVLNLVALDGTMPVAWAQADGPRPDLNAQGIGNGIGGFRLTLPLRFADEQPHTLTITTSDGQVLPGSPVTILAGLRGLAGLLMDLGRRAGEGLPPKWLAQFEALAACVGRLESLGERTVPFAEWPAYWALVVEPRLEALAAQTTARPERTTVFVLDGPGREDTLASCAALADAGTCLRLVSSVTDMSGADAGCISPERLPGLLRNLAREGGGPLLFVTAGTVLRPPALDALRQVARKGLVYSDYTIAHADATAELPALVPDWDYDLLLSIPYWGGVWGADAAIFYDAPPDTLSDDLTFLAVEHCPGAAIHHLPLPLFETARMPMADTAYAAAVNRHLRRVMPGARASLEVSGTACRVDWPVPVLPPRLTAIIPSRDNPDLLANCLDSLLPLLGTVSAEVRIIDNGSIRPDTLSLLERYSALPMVSILRRPGPFNFSALVNDAAAGVNQGILAVLNDDLRFATSQGDGWLTHILGFFSRPDVGVVGTKLLYPDATLQHGGITAGINGLTEHAFRGLPEEEAGYLGLARSTRACVAVTGACLFTRADLFQAMGGFDAALFPVNFNDVDYCLRLVAAGYKCLVTPHGRIFHLESASLGASHTPANAIRYDREAARFRRRWGHVLADSPCYHPLLGRSGAPYAGLRLLPTMLP